MKKILVIMIIIICACSSNNSKIPSDVERIPIDVHNVSSDVSSFIEKIEIVPLETTDSSLVKSYKKTMYDKDMDVYAIYGRDQVVLTFSGNGDFIASSKKMKGQGPQDYYMVVDVKFNPYLQGIDFLNPYGVIYTYSPKFELISKRKMQPEFYFDMLMALNSNDYVFTVPSIWVGQEVVFADLQTQQSDIADYFGTISSDRSMDRECFYKIGDDFYFVPTGINYYFYRMDVEKKKLIPIIYLDFGDSEIQEDDLPGFATGKRIGTEMTNYDETRSEIGDGMQKRSEYIRDLKLISPMIKFFNDDYVYVYFFQGSIGFGGHYIYNRKEKKGILLNEGKPFIMQRCFGIVDNVLLAICDPYYAPRLVDTQLMSPEEIAKMKQLKDDDNPVILKYYLRK